MELDVADEVVKDHVVDVAEPVRYVTISLVALQNDAVPDAIYLQVHKIITK